MTKEELIEALADCPDWGSVEIGGIGEITKVTAVYDGGWKQKDISGFVLWGPE